MKRVERPDNAINQANTSVCFGDAATNDNKPTIAEAKIPTNGRPFLSTKSKHLVLNLVLPTKELFC